MDVPPALTLAHLFKPIGQDARARDQEPIVESGICREEFQHFQKEQNVFLRRDSADIQQQFGVLRDAICHFLSPVQKRSALCQIAAMRAKIF